MKKLIMFLIVHVSPNAIFSQALKIWPPEPSNQVRPASNNDTISFGSLIPDTTCEYMHLSIRDVGFVISRKALSVRVNGYCVKHLQSNGRPFPVHYRVGWCEGRDELINRLIIERQCEGVSPVKNDQLKQDY